MIIDSSILLDFTIVHRVIKIINLSVFIYCFVLSGLLTIILIIIIQNRIQVIVIVIRETMVSPAVSENCFIKKKKCCENSISQNLPGGGVYPWSYSMTDEPVFPKMTDSVSQWFCDANINWLTQTSTASWDMLDINPSLLSTLENLCHLMASVRIKKEQWSNSFRSISSIYLQNSLNPQ